MIEKGVNFVLNQFEFEILLEGMTGTYLNFTISCFLQLRNISIVEKE